MAMTDTSPDLLSRYAQTRDPALADAIVGEAWGLAYQVCQRALGDVQAAEDAAQLAVLRVLERADRFESHRRFRPWVAAVAANVAREQARAQRRRRTREERAARRRPASGSAQDRLEIGEIRAVIAALPEASREALELRYFARLKISEIARLTDAGESTVRKRIKEGKDHLRSRLSKAGYSPAAITTGFGWLKAELAAAVPAAPSYAALAAKLGAATKTAAWAPWLIGAALSLLLALGVALPLITEDAPSAPRAAQAPVAPTPKPPTPKPAPKPVAPKPAAPKAPAPEKDEQERPDQDRDQERAPGPVDEAPRPAKPKPGSEPARGLVAAGRCRLTVTLKGEGSWPEAWIMARKAWRSVPEPQRSSFSATSASRPFWALPTGARKVGKARRAVFEIPAGPTVVQAGAIGAETAMLELTAPEGEHAVSLSLKAEAHARLELTIVDTRGEPVPFQQPSMQVQFEKEGEESNPFYPKSGPNLLTMAVGRYKIVGSCSGFGGDCKLLPVSVTLKSGDSKSVKVVRTDPPELSDLLVRVVDESGAPVAGAKVMVVPSIPQVWNGDLKDMIGLPRPGLERLTGPDGLLRGPEITSQGGPAMILVREGDRAGRSAVFDPAKTRETTVTLNEAIRSGEVAIKLLIGERGDQKWPRDQTLVCLINVGDEVIEKIFHAGSRVGDLLTLENLRPGRYMITVYSEYDRQYGSLYNRGDKSGRSRLAFSPRSLAVTVVDKVTLRKSLRFPELALAELQVKVSHADGRFFRGSVSLERHLGGVDIAVGSFKKGEAPGLYNASAVCPGEKVSLTVYGDGVLPTRLRPFTVGDGPHSLRIPELPRQRIAVRGPDGEPAVDVSLNIDGFSDEAFKVGASGVLGLHGEKGPRVIGTGLSFSSPYARIRIPRRFEPGDDGIVIRLEKSVSRANARVSGRVIDAEGEPVAGASFALIGPGGYPTGRKRLSDADGRFVLNRCEAGRNLLRVHHGLLGLGDPMILDLPAGGELKDVVVTLRQGTPLSVQLQRPRRTGQERIALLDLEGREWSRMGNKHTVGLPARPDGRCDFGPVPAGDWIVVARAGERGRELARKRITVGLDGGTLVRLKAP